MKRLKARKDHIYRRKAYFFSDAHLGVGDAREEQQKEEELIQFLRSIKRSAAEIYMLGDLFDYWFEYKTVVPKGYYRLFTTFSELRHAGVRLHYIVGNHDFWVDDYFEKEFDMKIYRSPVEKVILGKRFFLHHGDGLLKNDFGYNKILKPILRNPLSIFLYYLLHPDFAGKIARWSSHKSRLYTANRTYEEQSMIEFAEAKVKEGVDYVIMGHNHKALMVMVGNGMYVNVGEWMKLNTYAVFDGVKIELKQWNFQRTRSE
ncbi:MAG: UDP-2,3-diacylglucosamine diphosphatase [Bacteroidetes bacterium]|nr:UDP-2,3-diacylglucosamine diphosphatase [Bacteroidota bacterium]